MTNKAKLRRDISENLANMFNNASIEYTCRAAVTSYCRPFALEEAKKLLKQNINFSKSNYPFTWVYNMADMFCSSAADVIHEEYLKLRNLK